MNFDRLTKQGFNVGIPRVGVGFGANRRGKDE